MCRIVTGALELCELAVTLCPKELGDIEGALDIVTEIYLENYPGFSTACRSLMCTILSNRAAYYGHKVKLLNLTCDFQIAKVVSVWLDKYLFGCFCRINPFSLNAFGQLWK